MTDWLFKPYLEKGTLNILSGRSGVGKTHYTAQLLNAALDMISDIEILYMVADNKVSSFEDTWIKLTGKPIKNYPITVVSVSEYLATFPTDSLTFWTGDREPYKLFLKTFTAFCTLHKGKTIVCILDPGLCFFPCQNENSAKQVASACQIMQSIAERTNAVIIATWHTNKVYQDRIPVDPRDMIAHSHAVQGYTNLKLLIHTVPDDPDNFHFWLVGKQFKDLKWEQGKDDKGFFEAIYSKPSELKITSKEQDVYNYIKIGITTPVGLSHSLEISSATTYRYLSKLLDAGLIKQVSKGNYEAVEV